ncbi:FAP1 [Candida pseudojiufengensis]|uniref:FAP1 n=1 Tax=Candida pseudojiufengensis TaxID=497109 RepID=UPI0022246356|nr:FAP1 [Candida pseudojiufengensis]KAI5966740.1 FAP1 [Candida pseudojiufengensis]
MTIERPVHEQVEVNDPVPNQSSRQDQLPLQNQSQRIQTFIQNGIEIEIQQHEEDLNSLQIASPSSSSTNQKTKNSNKQHKQHKQHHQHHNHNHNRKPKSKAQHSYIQQQAHQPQELDESLGSTIITEIQQDEYICLVCTSSINQDSTIWSCSDCFRVYDLDCIQSWATKGSSTNKTNKTWRCPACNVENSKIPKNFTCWCGKIKNPEKNPLMPFSCGNSCNFKYSDCIHRCLNICHPGKHPVCGATGPLLKCHCGKEKKQLPCLITPYKRGWKCDLECNKVLCDLGHKCEKGCHNGSCGKCQQKLEYKCYCGDTILKTKCFKRKPLECENYKGEKWIGGGSCNKLKKIYYECGQHYETFECQPPPNLEILKCKYSPDLISTCYCGKTSIDSSNRTKCTDPVEECDNICGKLLSCGHFCKFKCHKGECECTEIFDIACDCGHEQFITTCKYLKSNKTPKCHHKCSVLLNCRKHYHRKECCEFESIALYREKLKKKAIRNNIRTNFKDDIMSIEASHICTQTCNRLKSCGQHYCQAMCHPGPCEVCLESTNDDLVCNCGKTIIPAPVRCGTELICHEQCIRPTECGHRQEIHECHNDSISCPKCTVIVQKSCDCGARDDLPGIICSQERISCGKMCTVPKDCGHPCLKTCSSLCTKESKHNESSKCLSNCSKIRNNCPHLCKQKCHFNKPGKNKSCDSIKCLEDVTINCSCGHLTKKVKCGASTIESTSIGTILPCDESCAIAKRDLQLKSAFSLETSTSTSDEDGDSIYSDFVLQTYNKQKKWCTKMEDIIRTFIEDYNLQIEKGIENPKRTYHFPSMTSPQRQFIHELSSSFKIYSESQDLEPKRSVFIVITRLTILPSTTLQEFQEYKLSKQQQINKYENMTQQEIDNEFFNCIIIQDTFFGITKEELNKQLLEKNQIDGFIISWFKENTFIIYDPKFYLKMDKEFEQILEEMCYSILKPILRTNSLAFDCKLALVDPSINYILKIDKRKIDQNLEQKTESKVIESKNKFDVLGGDDEFVKS